MPTEIWSSAGAHEIIGNPPSKIVRWGSSYIFLVLVLFGVTTWFIRYPDILTAKVDIVTNPNPTTLVSRSAGKLIIHRKENSVVKHGDVLAVIENPTQWEQVARIEKVIELNEHLSPEHPEFASELGDRFEEAVRAEKNYKQFVELKSYQRQIHRIENQLMTAQEQLKIAKE